MECSHSQLVFIPTPAMGHLVPAVELARRLVARHPHLSVTLFILRFPTHNDKVNAYLSAVSSDHHRRISLHHLPQLDNLPNTASKDFFPLFMEAYKPIIKRAAESLAGSSHPRLAGFILDTFRTAFADVVADLRVPSYVFFTSSAAFLRMLLHLESTDAEPADEPPEATAAVSGFKNKIPLKSWPIMFFDKDHARQFRLISRIIRNTDAVLINMFMKLEFDAIQILQNFDNFPPIYPIGPILDMDGPDHSRGDRGKGLTVEWLDGQPARSVVFLCFGSRESFGRRQVEETAAALEQSGHRFLWSLRRRGELVGGGMRSSEDYDSCDSVLPEGFLRRTAGRGRVIGWAPQAAVLGHAAVGAFVSHCGWNSALESVWFGVPVAAWPLAAEQDLNAFVLVEEVGVAVEVSRGEDAVVGAAEVAVAIGRVMGEEEGAVVRKEMEGVREKARATLEEGGSSYECLGRFVEHVFKTLP